MPDVLAIADDLTGALEAGAAFAQHGLRTLLTFGAPVPRGTQVHVIDAGTRHVSEEEAAAAITRFAQQHPAKRIYKKTDSTLRGNIRAELSALTAFGPVHYVPAYPQLGRTVRDGHLHVDGVPLEKTAFAQDPLHPIRSGHIAALLGDAPGITVSAANTVEEITEAAEQWLREGGVAAGPAALAHAAAASLRLKEWRGPRYPPLGRTLVAVGSRHPCSRGQIRFAAQALRQAEWATVESPETAACDPLLFAAQFGEQIKRHWQENRYDTLIIFGGDTAKAVLQAMRISTVEPIGEPLGGVAYSRLPGNINFITKAGGFGRPDLLLQLQKQLSHASP